MKKTAIILLVFVLICSVSFAEGKAAAKTITEKTGEMVGNVVNLTVVEPVKGIKTEVVNFAGDVKKLAGYTANLTAVFAGTCLDIVTLNRLKVADKINAKLTERERAESMRLSAEKQVRGWKTGMDERAARIKLLEDSAAALQGPNPDLAKGLSDLAADEARKLEELKELKAKHEARIKLLDDSAAALKKKNPDLAKGLKEIADRMRSGS